MIRGAILTLIFLSLTANMWAQHHSCGTQQHLFESRLDANKLALANSPVEFREQIYIPMTFTIVQKSNGTQGISKQAILDQLCVLNECISPYGITAYLKDGGIKYYSNTSSFEDPSTNGWRLNQRKTSNSVDVFVCNTAGGSSGSGGTVLGYYDPTYDFLVVRKAELISKSSTLCHELGHYLSLFHPFFGWEGDPYSPSKHGNPVDLYYTPDYNVEIEVMDGSNCNEAADKICDTPPDYLFALSTGVTTANCNLLSQVYDSDGELVKPMENNIMSYFDECGTYVFTPQQVDLMMADFNSSNRNHIRSNYTPNTAKITDVPEITSPTNGQEIDTYNSVYFDWSDVDNADNYLLEVKNAFTGEINEYITNSSEYLATDLDADGTYAFVVRPYSETSSCESTSQLIFTTGSTPVSTIDEVSFNSVKVYPNPIEGQNINIAIDAKLNTEATVSLVDIHGSVLSKKNIDIQSGSQTITLGTPKIAGIYFVNIKTAEGNVIRRITKQ